MCDAVNYLRTRFMRGTYMYVCLATMDVEVPTAAQLRKLRVVDLRMQEATVTGAHLVR